jgi:outer membrane receptor for ferrienterochelin and colicin/outer membrane protein W
VISYIFVGISYGQDVQGTVDSSVSTITVQALRPEWEAILSPGAVTVVEPDRFKGEQKNLAELLERVPGLFVHRVTGAGQYTTIRMRGSTSAQVNVYVDGILQNLGNDPAVDISLIPVSQVARIEVYRGYVPVRFAGSPLGGVINVVTRKADKLGFTAEAGTSSLRGKRYNFTATMPTFWNGSLLAGAHYDTSDGNFRFKQGDIFSGNYLPSYVAPVYWRKYNDYSNYDFLIKWQNQHISLKVGYKETDRSLPYPANWSQYNYISGRYEPNEYYKRQKVEQNDLVAGYRNTFGKLDLGLQLFYLKQKKRIQAYNLPRDVGASSYAYPDWPGSRFDHRDTVKKGVQFDASYQLGDHNLIEFYTDYSVEHLSVRANDWVLYPDNNNPPYIDTNKRYWPEFFEKRYHIQIQDTINLGNQNSTKLTVLFKLDKVESTGNDLGDDTWHQTWGLALVHQADDNISFRMTYGTFVRYPNFAERFGDGLYIMPTYWKANQNKAASWESGEQWDIGLDWNGEIFAAKGRASLSYFNRYTENMSVMYINRAGGYFSNAGHGTVDGFEFETYLSWSRLDMDFSATWQHGRMNFAHVYLGYSDTSLDHMITNLPSWQYHVRFNYRIPGDVLSVFAEYHFTDSLNKGLQSQIGELTTIEEGWVFDESFATINAGMSWQINEHLSLVAGVNDILNKSVMQGQYSETESHQTVPFMTLVDYPGAGRTYFATVRYEFGGHQSYSDTLPSSVSVLGSESSQQDSLFYLASKVAYSKLQTDLTGEDQTFSGGPNGTSFPYQPSPWQPVTTRYWIRANESFSGQVYGGQNKTSGVGVGLAFGLDLHKRYNIPLRMEVEADLNSRRNIEYAGIEINPYSNRPNPSIGTLTRWMSKQNLQLKMSTIFLNAFFDLYNSTRFTPYFGGGIGVTKYNYKITQSINFTYSQNGATDSRLDLNDYGGSEYGNFIRSTKGWGVTWNLTAGFSYQLSPSTFLDFSYRYVNYDNQPIDKVIPSELYRLQGVTLGQGYLEAYTSVTGQTIKMDAHQAVLALRYDLGAGVNATAEYERKKSNGFKIFGSLTGPSLLASPAIRPGSFSISPRIGLFLPEHKFGLSDGYVAGLSVGYNITGKWGVEVTVDMSNHVDETSGVNYSGDTRVSSAHLNAVYHIVDPDNTLSRWVPYATAGMGMVWSRGNFSTKEVLMAVSVPFMTDQPTGDYSSIAVNAGIGIKYFLNQNVAIRVEALDTFAFKDADFQRDKGPYHNLAVSGGLTFQFGGIQ